MPEWTGISALFTPDFRRYYVFIQKLYNTLNYIYDLNNECEHISLCSPKPENETNMLKHNSPSAISLLFL